MSNNCVDKKDMSSFWSKKSTAFNPNKLKANLRMAITRLRMQQNKLVNGIKIQRRQVAELLALQKYESARVRVEQVLRDDVSIEGYEVLALFLDLLSNRVHLITNISDECVSGSGDNRKKGLVLCPPELKESITSVLWAAAQLGNVVPELQNVSKCFEAKLGADFVAMSVSNAEFSVNQKIIERLGFNTPSNARCIEYLTNVATEYSIEGYDEQRLLDPSGLVPSVSTTENVGTSLGVDVDTTTLGSVIDPTGVPEGGIIRTPSGFLLPALTQARDELECRLLQLKRG